MLGQKNSSGIQENFESANYLETVDYNGLIPTRNPKQDSSFRNEKPEGKHIFDYEKNGVRLDVNVVPIVNETVGEEDDHFPMVPIRDLGKCILDLSITCVRDRVARYIDAIGRLKYVNLIGNYVKFIKVRNTKVRRFIDPRAIGTNTQIDRSIDDFFDKFILRITVPKWNLKKKEQNQIDLTFGDTGVVEGNFLLKSFWRRLFVSQNC